eukprot:TRINITY_DN3885_c0_g1_i1.p1 TRINITY_DN3885_c0_g1~~TRINITY_DN3885_c0_g1_i1.p1  ORF type:complete len:497 (-),score=62.70 TRINITY_DN3885_c0_g1_i1:188-1621(-)
MIFYNEGTWGILFGCQVKGSVFPKGLAWALPFALISVGLNYLSRREDLKDVLRNEDFLEVVKGYTVALAFLILFRTQIAYGRMMEGVTYLQQMRSSWVNVVSCCFAFCSQDPEKQIEVEGFQNHLVRLVSLLNGVSLQSLHKSELIGDYQIFDISSVETLKIKWLMEETHKPEIVMQWVQRLIVQGQRSGIIDIAPPILSRVFEGLDQGLSALAGAQKLNAVPFPFPYAQMISILLISHTLITSYVAGVSLENVFGSFGLTFMVCLAFWTLNYIAMELEYPFGEDANDLPLANIQEELNERIGLLLHKHTSQAPGFNVKVNMKCLSEKKKPMMQSISLARGPMSHVVGRDVSMHEMLGREGQRGSLEPKYEILRVGREWSWAPHQDKKAVFKAPNNFNLPADATDIPSMRATFSTPGSPNSNLSPGSKGRNVAADRLALIEEPDQITIPTYPAADAIGVAESNSPFLEDAEQSDRKE